VSDAIFIIGYYRSGTSALSGTLQRLGVALHNDADANEHNPLGFYEIPELIEFDLDLFGRFTTNWTDVRDLEERWWERADMAPYLSRLEEIMRRRFGQEPLWGIKHPHMCRLLPLYERAARQADNKVHVIHMCRDPWTVAASQERKNGLARAHALMLWASYMVTAERHARHLPRSWLTYHDLLARPASEIRRLEQELGLPLSHAVPNGLREATAFLTSQLDRSKPLAKDSLFGAVRDLVDEMWQAMRDHDATPERWDGFAATIAALTGFLAELGASKGPVLPWLGTGAAQTTQDEAGPAGLRPAERTDPGARARLLERLARAGDLPTICVIIASPPNRAHAINDTLESLRAQWHAPASIRVIASDAVELTEVVTIQVSEEAGAVTTALCKELKVAAASADYVAVLNAGDIVSPDACLRFALEAQTSAADLIYCDEVVPRDGNPWVRHKPAWDITRLRQSPYPGDWAWYRAETFLRLGGLDPAFAGAEEYDYQLRLSETAAHVVRLPEALFQRNMLSRRDNIPSTVFIRRAAEAIAANLARSGIPAVLEPRQHPGLYRHVRAATDPGTTVILLCDGAEIAMLDIWLREILTQAVLTGPIILAGADLSPPVQSYLTQVIEKIDVLERKVLAVPPSAGLRTGDALREALARVATEHVAIIDARSQSATPDWLQNLRNRLADPRVALVGGRTLTPLPKDKTHFTIQGPIIIGAEARMGATHLTDDPGPGGWLAIDQEASAVAPPNLLARSRALAACVIPSLSGDALWIDLCAQLRAAGGAVVWTPDVSFVIGAQAIGIDVEGAFRTGSDVARTLPWEDPFHHPALSLRADPLAAERRQGLVRAAPADPNSLLLSGAPDAALGAINAARALRAIGALEATWTSENLLAAEVARRAPTSWIRLNPDTPAPAHAPGYTALVSKAPKPESKAILAAAQALYATSPELVTQVRKLLPPSRAVTLWRPALSRPIWADLKIGTGINSRNRILWIDEGMEPPWLPDLINEFMPKALWIIVERPGGSYQGAVTRMRAPETEQAWARELAGIAPHIMIRPAGDHGTEADHFKATMAAAVGCHLLVDDRLDIPEALGAVRLPNRIAAWQRALRAALDDFPTTLERGRRARTACLDLPAIEDTTPGWARPALVRQDWAQITADGAAGRHAAE
jgi:hypothetical protein